MITILIGIRFPMFINFFTVGRRHIEQLWCDKVINIYNTTTINNNIVVDINLYKY